MAEYSSNWETWSLRIRDPCSARDLPFRPLAWPRDSLGKTVSRSEKLRPTVQRKSSAKSVAHRRPGEISQRGGAGSEKAWKASTALPRAFDARKLAPRRLDASYRPLFLSPVSSRTIRDRAGGSFHPLPPHCRAWQRILLSRWGMKQLGMKRLALAAVH